MGYSRVGSSLLSRASRPWTFAGYSDAGSTCSPSFVVLATAVMFRFIVRSVAQHCPGDPRHLVGESGRRHVRVRSLGQRKGPSAEPVGLAWCCS